MLARNARTPRHFGEIWAFCPVKERNVRERAIYIIGGILLSCGDSGLARLARLAYGRAIERPSQLRVCTHAKFATRQACHGVALAKTDARNFIILILILILILIAATRLRLVLCRLQHPGFFLAAPVRGNIVARSQRGNIALREDCFHLALPDDDHLPAQRLQLRLHLRIALPVAAELRLPEIDVACGRARRLAALVVMPKASVHEYHRPVLRQHNIRLPRQILPVNPEPIPQRMQQASHRHLRLRVLALVRHHHPVPLLWCHRVHLTQAAVLDNERYCAGIC